MSADTKTCKICGKEYKCCKTMRRVEGVFRWQDVACCVEHGQEYLNLVLAARAKTPSAAEVPAAQAAEAAPKKTQKRRKKEEV